MLHHSCDRCKRMLNSETEVRYVVKMEIYPAAEPLDCDQFDDDRDSLLELQEMLDELAEEGDEVFDEIYEKKRYDLCADCCRQYMKNPIGPESAVQLGFSNN